MMSQISDEPAAVATPVCVIGPQFVTPNPLEVIVETNSIGSLLVTDVNHKVMLKAKTCNTTFHHQLLLLHADDRPIAMVRHKMMTGHKRWKVYLGDSVAKSDIIFSTQAAHAIQSKTNVHVFLAKNKRKKGKWDFMIKGSWSRRNCTIWMGDSASIIAQMHTMDVPENARFVKDRFMLGVNANVDYAFVVSLIAIVDATKRTSMKNKLIESGSPARPSLFYFEDPAFRTRQRRLGRRIGKYFSPKIQWQLKIPFVVVEPSGPGTIHMHIVMQLKIVEEQIDQRILIQTLLNVVIFMQIASLIFAFDLERSFWSCSKYAPIF
ncbi:hypothetical protein R6Q59_018368 [Mikania micrantha]